MSRIATIVLSISAVFFLMGMVGAAGMVLGGLYFSNSAFAAIPTATVTDPPPPPLVTPTTASVPDSTATADPTIPPVETAVMTTATAIAAVQTSTKYIKALTDVNIRSGPGTEYSIIGWVATGRTATVTGVSNDANWWRVVCADGTIGNCWMTARPLYTQPTEAPATPLSVTPTAAACTNAATFVADVTVPDNSEIDANTTFMKIWRIQNSGTCTWDDQYQLVPAGGPLLGANVTMLPMPGQVGPGQTVELTLIMLAPATPGAYQSDWKIQTPQNTYFGMGRSNTPLWVKIKVIEPESRTATVTGLVYRDKNGNGVYDPNEQLLANREVWLSPETSCHLRNQTIASARSGDDGRYTLTGSFNGSYCLALPGANTPEDLIAVYLEPGKTLNDVNLHAETPTQIISGYVWNDYCAILENGAYTNGNCVPDGSGSFRADGLLQTTESHIPGVTVLLQPGACLNNSNAVSASVTDKMGRYTFSNLNPGRYCIFINATDNVNKEKLLPGEWTFPGNGVWYHETELQPGENVYAINFGWDYHFNQSITGGSSIDR